MSPKNRRLGASPPPLIVKCSLILLQSWLVPFTAFAQGSLAPPAGPSPTMKSLDQIEARSPVDAVHTPGDAGNSFIISQPGSYYLTGNISGVSGQHGIAINADNVALDLNGFSMVGIGTNSAIIITGHTNIVIRNGTLRGWNAGIDTPGVNSKMRVEKVNAISITATGITVAPNSVVADCVAESCSAGGITGGANALIERCQAISCGVGISMGSPNPQIGMVNSCRAVSNNIGFSLDHGTVAVNCQALSNTGAAGFVVSALSNVGVTLTDCSAISNSGKGIDATAGSAVLIACNVIGNSGAGIDLGPNSVVRDCTIQQGATSDGINLGPGSSLCWIYNNHISSAGSNHNGITLAGPGNRIDGNTFTGGSAGSTALIVPIGTNPSANIITRNVFINSAQTVFFNTPQKSAEFLTFSSGQVSTDPWANIQ